MTNRQHPADMAPTLPFIPNAPGPQDLPVPLPVLPDNDPLTCTCGVQFAIAGQVLLHIAAIMPDPASDIQPVLAWHSPFNHPDHWCLRPFNQEHSRRLHALLATLGCPLHEPHHPSRIPDSRRRLRLRSPCLDATWSWYDGDLHLPPATTIACQLERWIGTIDRRSWPQHE